MLGLFCLCFSDSSNGIQQGFKRSSFFMQKADLTAMSACGIGRLHIGNKVAIWNVHIRDLHGIEDQIATKWILRSLWTLFSDLCFRGSPLSKRDPESRSDDRTPSFHILITTAGLIIIFVYQMLLVPPFLEVEHHGLAI